jgi:L-asparaginase
LPQQLFNDPGWFSTHGSRIGVRSLGYDSSISITAPFDDMSLRIIATGGTFDKHYDEISGQLGFSQSHLPEALVRARITLPLTFEPLMMIDSLDMTDEDRRRILAACTDASETRIVVVHGTDTMPETAETLAKARLGKTIVLAGAMVPYELAHSDAMFNLGFACCAAQTLPEGVYIAMNAQVFKSGTVHKNRVAGIFQSE